MIATMAAVAGTWTAASIPTAVLIGRRLRHLEDQTMPDQPDTTPVRVDSITVQRKDSGWTLPFLSPDVQECTTNHIPDYDGPACTDTAVWKVARVHPGMRASIGFWCDTHLPAEHRPAAEQSAVDSCRLVEVGGEPIRVRGSGELTEQGRAALASLVGAARRRHTAEQARHDDQVRAAQAEAAIARVRDRCQQVRARVGSGGMINASQILGLLSPTWPDGNTAAADRL